MEIKKEIGKKKRRFVQFILPSPKTYLRMIDFIENILQICMEESE